MTTEVQSLAPGETLQTVLDALPKIDGPTPQARHNMASGIRTFAKVLDRTPAQIPIEARVLSSLFDKALPARCGLKPTRWRNVKTDVRRAVRLSLSQDPAKKPPPVVVSEGWQVAVATGPETRIREVLLRFARFCHPRGVEPDGVSEDVVAAFEAHLNTYSLSKCPVTIVGYVFRFWNRHVVPAGLGQHLTPPVRRPKIGVDWCDVPASLAEEARRYLDAIQHSDPFDENARPPVAPITATTREGHLRRLIGGQRAAGIDLAELNSLADVVRPDRVKASLTWFLERSGGKKTIHLRDLSRVALTIARHWAKSPPEDVQVLKGMARKLMHRQTGLTEKNQQRLAQFANPASVTRLLDLPDVLMAKARKKHGMRKGALRAQEAVAIRLLLSVPLRIKNLLMLDRDGHFEWRRFEGAPVLHLVIPKVEVKNKVALEVPLSADVVALMDEYLKRFQPTLTGDASSRLLFPGRGTSHIRHTALRRRLIEVIKRETALVMNPHLFRHFGAFLYLEANPGDYETVRRVLGHRKLETTINAYVGLETSAAAKRYDEVILSRRSGNDHAR